MDSAEKGTFYIVVSRIAFFSAGYLIYFALGRFLPPEQFGIYGIVLGLFSTVNLILVTAIQQAVAKFVSSQSELAGEIKRKSLKLQTAFDLCLFVAYFLAAPFIAMLLNDASLTPLIQFSGIIFLSHPIYSVFGGYLSGLGKFKRFALLEIAYSCAKALLVIGLAVAGFAVWGAVAGFLIASLFAMVLGGFVSASKKQVGRFDSGKIVAFALPLLGFAAIQGFLTNIDLFAVKALSPANPDLLSGYYFAAQTISRIPQLFVFAVNVVLFPLVAASISKKDNEKTSLYINSSIRYLLLLLVPLTALIAANAKEIISLVYPEKYAPAAASLAILSLGALFYSLFLITTSVISGSGKPKASLAIGFASLAALFALLFLLIPTYSIEGAAIAATVSYAFGFLLSGSYVLLKFKALVQANAAAKIAIAGAITFVASLFVQATGLLVIAELLLMLLLFAGLLFAMKGIGKRDFAVFLRIVR